MCGEKDRMVCQGLIISKTHPLHYEKDSFEITFLKFLDLYEFSYSTGFLKF